MEEPNKPICVSGRMVDNPEMKPIISELSQMGRKFILITDATDELDTIASARNMTFIVQYPIIKEGEDSVNVVGSNLSLLKEKDEILFMVNSVSDINYIEYFIKTKAVQRPEVVIQIHASSDEEYTDMLVTAMKLDVVPTIRIV